MIKKNATARLQLILVNKTKDRHVVLTANTSGYYGVVVVDNLLQVAYTHRCSPQIINLASFLLILLLLWLESFLVSDELLLHKEIVLDPLLLEQP